MIWSAAICRRFSFESRARQVAPLHMLLFSYGTLQENHVQIANFGRELEGCEDALPGYTIEILPVSNYANAVQSMHPQDAITGTVFEVTEDDLIAADKYEEDADYKRILVTLRSGKRAWIYVRS